jgi:D-3-phosphoglycerate dehydrogenase
MKVLVADKFEQSGLDGLKAAGAEVIYNPDAKDEALTEALRQTGAQVLIVRSTKVTEAHMDGSALRLIVRAGAGYNTIDVEAASRRGIYVSNCPGKNAQAVAELAFGLMIAADRHIPDNVTELRAGRWNKKGFGKARGLYGRTLGLVGLGSIGRDMIPRAKAFGMPVIAFSRHLSEAEASTLGIARVGSLLELAEKSDFVSVHCSLTPETKGSLNADFFAALRPGTVFVNTSRSEVVDQAALLEAVRRGVFACLDVFEGEPTVGEGAYDGELRNESEIYCTHHIGASTDQAQEAVAEETVRIVREFQETGVAPNAVNQPDVVGAR